MFDIDARRDALAASPTHGRDTRPLVEALLRELLQVHPSLRAVRWTQSLDHPSPDVFVTHDVVIKFTDGTRFLADTATFHDDRRGGFDAEAYAAVATILLTQTDLLVAAFGLPATVTASRDGIETTPHAL